MFRSPKTFKSIICLTTHDPHAIWCKNKLQLIMLNQNIVFIHHTECVYPAQYKISLITWAGKMYKLDIQSSYYTTDCFILEKGFASGLISVHITPTDLSFTLLRTIYTSPEEGVKKAATSTKSWGALMSI